MMACTTSGERKASERVIRIERSLQRSRMAISSVPAYRTGEKFLEPSPAARDRLEDAAAILNLHRTQVWLSALRYQDLTTALRRVFEPGQVDRSVIFAVDRDLDLVLVERDPMQMVEDQIAVAQLRVRRGCRPHRTDHERLDLEVLERELSTWLGLPLQHGLGDVVAVAA